MIVSRSAAAIAEPVDYFCVGPCWPTPTKPGRPAPGLPLVRCHRRAGVRQTVVRHRRHRRGPAARCAGRRRASNRGGAGDHRRGGSAGRGASSSVRHLQQRADPRAQLRRRVIWLARGAPHEDSLLDLDRARQVAPQLVVVAQAADLRRGRAAVANWPRIRDAAAVRPPRPRRPSAARRFRGWARSAAVQLRRRRRWCRSSACQLACRGDHGRPHRHQRRWAGRLPRAPPGRRPARRSRGCRGHRPADPTSRPDGSTAPGAAATPPVCRRAAAL